MKLLRRNIIQIIDFTHEHIEQAQKLAQQNYEEERYFVPALPSVDSFPDLSGFAENGLGVAAFEGKRMIGYLCSVSPFQNAFGGSDAVGIFSPMGANGAAEENRANIYARMYQAAGTKWAKAGASSHAVCLYAHDRFAQEQFFKYGFGLRCIDATLSIDEIVASPCEGYNFTEFARAESSKINGLRNLLTNHMKKSPCFINRNEQDVLDIISHRDMRIFTVTDSCKPIGFIEIMTNGENFACDASDMMNICGAYLLPEYRGKDIFTGLLYYVINTLNSEGYHRLGVNFESINPTAYGFWLKHFNAYTHSVVRRIDERAIKVAL